MTVLAERRIGLNWEVAAPKLITMQDVLESAKDSFPHDCVAELDGREERDGTPYGDTATTYYLVVKGPKDTNPKFVNGIKDVLATI
jgi:hypothetical protein